MLGVSGNRSQSLSSGLEQEVVHDRLVLIGERTDRPGQGEDQVIVTYGQEIYLARFQPAPGGTDLTLWTMPVTIGIVGDLGLLAGKTTQHMTAECRISATLDG